MNIVIASEENEKVDTIIHSNDISINDPHEEIKLDTGWEFYWNQLIFPENFSDNSNFTKVSLENWANFSDNNTGNLPSFGYATYRLKFSIPTERTQSSLYIPAAYASSKLWINGELISEIGQVGTSKETTIHRRFSQIIPLKNSDTDF